ncbi:protein ATP6V1FNB-like [Harmonia axyridis]|uniref:protein ATP6V1FNB-like n=1 Tax=Harmonia axyridis TaxID=115357 RepID=UPI001E276BA4|nr:protein ATP6V1FNB-like [Harmonia axyridis]
MAKQVVWTQCIEKENFLRLKWFTKNEERLNEIANAPLVRTVPQELKDDMRAGRISRFQNVDRKNVKKQDEQMPFGHIDPRIHNVMQPVDPKTLKLLYAGTQRDGRKNYWNARVKIIPENRYYFPETSSFEYGWKMWNASRTMAKSRHGRREVIREFYRRAGVGRDPDWHKEPAKLSPTICGSI